MNQAERVTKNVHRLTNAIPRAAAAALLLLSTGCLFFVNLDLNPSKSPYEEVVLKPASSFWTDEKVAIVDLHGMIFKHYDSSGLFSSPLAPDPVSDLTEALHRAGADSDVKAVVLRIDSPGGAVSWSDMLHREVMTFRKKSGKPVVACITGMGASGAYYTAMAADTVCAAPTATVGSIGVIAIFLNLEKLAGKIGVETEVIKSGARKDMGGLWRGMAPEEKKIMQDMVDEFYHRFVDIILAGRSELTREELLPLADGRLFTAQQALEHRLIDRIAYLEEAVDLAKAAAGLEDAALVTYGRSNEYKSTIYSQANPTGQASPTVNVVNLDLGSVTRTLPAGLYYLWAPGR